MCFWNTFLIRMLMLEKKQTLKFRLFHFFAFLFTRAPKRGWRINMGSRWNCRAFVRYTVCLQLHIHTLCIYYFENNLHYKGMRRNNNSYLKSNKTIMLFKLNMQMCYYITEIFTFSRGTSQVAYIK